MTPKEKAQELFKRYYPLVYCFVGSGMLTNTEDETTKVNYAKQCALIAVDEILNSYDPINEYEDSEWKHEDLTFRFILYWQQVKNEIEKL